MEAQRMRKTKRRGAGAAAAAILTAWLAGPAGAQEPAEETPPPAPKVERARIVPPSPPGQGEPEKPEPAAPAATIPPAAPVEARPGHHAVREVRLVKAGGGRVDGARQDDWIAFDMVGGDERYDVYVMQIGIGVERCLTCEIWSFKKAHVLSPAWHPSGDHLVVQAQGQPKRRGLDAVELASPHRGVGCELWVVTRDGRDAFQITQLVERGGAVLDPHFSHEAGLLAWSERLTSREPPWGEWAVRVVDFQVRRGVPRLGKTRTYSSGIGQGLAVVHGFTPDDAGVLVSAIPDHGLPEPDILRVDLASGRIDRLTSSPDQSDELVSAVPYSDYFVWVTDRGLGDPRQVLARGPLPRRTEVWLRSASGMAQERLTYFNHPDSSHYLGSAMVSDLSWTADGESLLLSVVSVPEGTAEVREGIFLVKLGKEYRR
jgi:hypothetical protein